METHNSTDYDLLSLQHLNLVHHNQNYIRH